MMHADKKQEITKDMVYTLLKELANRYRKVDRKGYQPADIIIVGGGSVLLNYNFRQSTVDIDAILHVSSVIKDIAISLSEEYNISSHWLNSDFTILSSYSPKLEEVSKLYRSYNGGKFIIRTVAAEYLIAMKMQAGRLYNNDLPDIIGILAAEKQNGNNITYETIKNALNYLYEDKLTVQEELCGMVKEYCNMTSKQLWVEYDIAKGLTQMVNSEIIKTENKNKITDKNDAKVVGKQIFDDILKEISTINDPELKELITQSGVLLEKNGEEYQNNHMTVMTRITEAEARGETRGELNERLNTIKRMLSMGFDIDTIKEASGADDKDIRRARKEIYELENGNDEGVISMPFDEDEL